MTVERTDTSTVVHAKRIGIVGAGAAGLAAAQVFSQNSAYEITVFERSNDIGGIWNFTPDVSIKYNVPQDSAANAVAAGYDKPTSTGGYPTPVYEGLRTNLPKDVMQFLDAAYPDKVPVFPTHSQVREYLHTYAENHNLLRFVQLNNEVTALAFDNARQEWQCTVRRLGNGIEIVYFDAMIICTGRCTHPLIPDVPGLSELSQKRPGSVIHAKEFRRAADFADKTVLVVGFASSGSDCSRMLSYTAKHVYVSMSEPPSANGSGEPVLENPSGKFGDKCNPDNMPEPRPHIKEIDVKNDSVVFEDNTTIAIPDIIIYATGYLTLVPFIHSADDLALQPTSVDYSPAFTDGVVVNDIYKFTVFIPNPTLGILGLPFRVVPFPMYQYQSLLLARIFAGLPLPSQRQMKQEWDAISSAKPGSRVFDMGLGQVEFQNDILDFVGGSELLCQVSETWIERRKQAPKLRRQELGY